MKNVDPTIPAAFLVVKVCKHYMAFYLMGKENIKIPS